MIYNCLILARKNSKRIINKNLINWPDGIFSKLIKKKIKKIPGRKVLTDLLITKDIKRIIVLGNLSKNSADYLKRNFNLPIIHKTLPFGSVDKITKKINFQINYHDLNFNSVNVSEELSHPIKGFLVGSLVINSNIHLSFFAVPDCIGFLFGI